MNAMNLQARKLELVQMILNTDRPNLLEKVSQILKQEQEADWWDELPISVQQAIEAGSKEADRGETTPHEEVMKDVRLRYGL
jgi:predicted transcriptional regulator